MSAEWGDVVLGKQSHHKAEQPHWSTSATALERLERRHWHSVSADPSLSNAGHTSRPQGQAKEDSTDDFHNALSCQLPDSSADNEMVDERYDSIEPETFAVPGHETISHKLPSKSREEVPDQTFRVGTDNRSCGDPDILLSAAHTAESINSGLLSDGYQSKQTRIIVIRSSKLKSLFKQLDSPQPTGVSADSFEGSQVDVAAELRWKKKVPYLAIGRRQDSNTARRPEHEWYKWNKFRECSVCPPEFGSTIVGQPIGKGDDVLVKVLIDRDLSSTSQSVNRPARILRLFTSKALQQKLTFAIILWYYDYQEASSTVSAEGLEWPSDVQYVVSDHVEIVDCRTIVGFTDEGFKQNVTYHTWLSTADEGLVAQRICLKDYQNHWQGEEPVWRLVRPE